jgi:hypothetical protein
MNYKYRDIIWETLQENFRKGGFLRIYPSKNSNIYDNFFNKNPIKNKIIQNYH